MLQGDHSFLEQLAKELWNKYKADLDRLYVILPSRRARIFLIEAFKEIAENAAWLPTINSMEDFISEISTLHNADDLDLLFEFYTIYKKIEGEKADSLEDFMGWASILLYDFNEIDRNLIDPIELFGYLSEQKAAENWNFGNEELTDYQKKYLNFWNRFIHYYEGLKGVLEEKKLTYQGMLYKDALGKLKNEADALLNEDIYCFAGFNAFTPAEKAIIDQLKEHRETLFFWDADRYYLDDNLMEAGQFLRSSISNPNRDQWIGDNLLTEEKEINIYGISGNIGQAKLLGELLEANAKANDDLTKKAVVLADESLLLPVLESLPEMVSPLNITMGYPVKQTAFYSFFYNFFQLFHSKSTDAIYYKDLFTFLETPLSSKIVEPSKLRSVLDRIRKEQLIYIPLKRLKDEFDSSFGFIFNDSINALEKGLTLIDLIRKEAKLDDLELEILYHFYKLFNKFQELHKNTPINAQTLMSLYRQSVSRSQLSFVGEPLEGLQIMGVLESRTLDFDEIYLLSMNEGILPSGKAQNSLIPFNIKKEFGLPTYKEKDAIFAYHFYRLLQRCKKVHLIYNSGINPLSGGEKSRFIEQLLFEVPLKNPIIKINEVQVESGQVQEKIQKEEIEKSEEVIEKIKEKISTGLSASALNTYLTCPLDFYYKYVLGLREDQVQDPEDDMEAALFGSILHDTLEKLYELKDGDDGKLAKEKIDQYKDRLIKVLINTFKDNGITKWEKGKNKLVFEVCKTYLEHFLAWEEHRIDGNEIILQGIEDEITWSTHIELENGETLPLTLNGKIDRVESENGVIQIIDYKSGMVEPKHLKIDDVEDVLRRDDSKYSYPIQLGIYKLLYKSKYNRTATAGIISLRNIKEGLMIAEGLDEESCLELIKQIVEKMLSKDEVFKHTPQSQVLQVLQGFRK